MVNDFYEEKVVYRVFFMFPIFYLKYLWIQCEWTDLDEVCLILLLNI